MSDFLQRISAERARHTEKFGSEFDVRNDVNQWAAIAAHYLFDEVRRGGRIPDKETFETNFIKAAAVILAALEHADSMVELGYVIGEKSDKVGFNDILTKIEK